MEKIQTINEFKALSDQLASDRVIEHPTVVISAGTCGQASGANKLIRATKKEIIEQGLSDKIRLRITGCHGFCQIEPCVLIEPEGILYPNVKPEDIPRIIKTLENKEILEDLLYKDPKTGKPIAYEKDIPFNKKQVRSLLEWNRKVDPIRIHDYITHGGYGEFIQLLEENNPEKIIEDVKKSGLRGRGGAGFPTGLKWELLSKQQSKNGKYLVCNADEGDPGAYMDRSVLEGNPHSIIEGMSIASLGTGANEGMVYVRTEYPLAIKNLTIAIDQAQKLGILGNNIFNTDLSFNIAIVRGAGAFVCGEETALIHSIEGKMGEPRQRPPYPIHKGINGSPTVINNVETWANIPLIFRMGTEKFSQIGTKGNSGTKIFSLVGKIKNTGLIEIPMGMTIGEIVFDIGGGPSGEAKVKSVQTGGPSGGCIPVDKFDLPIDYDSLVKAGSIMGSGGMIVMDENTCMVDVAKYYMNFLKDESCGKCFSCRKGTQRMYELLDDITRGEGTLEHLDLLEELALVVKDASMCGLGQTAPNPVLSTLKFFREEYEAHILGKRCPALVCKSLIHYYIIEEKCTGCQRCVKVCPTGAITGIKSKPHNIDQTKCEKCNACYEICKFGAITID